MLKEATNIFIPQFAMRKDSNVLHQTVENWCNNNNIKVSAISDAAKLAIELEVR